MMAKGGAGKIFELDRVVGKKDLPFFAITFIEFSTFSAVFG
ncbi:MAG: hypothetical protein ACJAZW_001808 [Maritalea sp.]|jgi:hypothetical protein